MPVIASWTLIIVVIHIASGGNVATVTTHGFATKADCVEAGKMFARSESNRGLRFSQTFECVKR